MNDVDKNDDNMKVSIDYETDITKYSFSMRRKVATRLETREDVLDILSYDPESSIRARVASNSSTSKETLLRMTKDENPIVRREILINKHLDKKLFDELVNDKHMTVKLRIIECPFITNDILNKYMKDDEKRVRIYAELKLNGIEIKHNINLHASEMMTPSYQTKNKKDSKIVNEDYLYLKKIKSLNEDDMLKLFKEYKEKIKSMSGTNKLYFDTKDNFIKDQILILENNESLPPKVLIEIYHNAINFNGYYQMNNKTYRSEIIINMLFEKFTNNDFITELVKEAKKFSFFYDSKNHLTIEQLNIIFQDSLTRNDSIRNFKLILTAPNIDQSLMLKIFEFYKIKSKSLEDYEKMDFIEVFCKNNKNTIEINDFFFDQIKNYKIDSEESYWEKEQRISATKQFLTYTNITKDILDYFKNTKNTDEIIGLIKNTSLPKEILNKLLNTNNFIIKEFLSLSKETPINTLEKLAKDKDLTIQMNACKTLDILFEEFERGELDLDI